MSWENISIFYKKDDIRALECQNCGYKIVKPYPKDKLCPKCGKNYLLKEVETKKKGKKMKGIQYTQFDIVSTGEEIACKYCGYNMVKPYPRNCPRCGKIFTKVPKPKQFETKTKTLSSKLEGKVKVKKKAQSIVLERDKIELQKGESIQLLGITSVGRTPLFCSNEKFVYLLELTNNLDYIASSILEGELDKMLLVSEINNEKQKCQFYFKDDLIYIAYGTFPDKKGKWLLEQMAKHYSELIADKDIENLNKLDKHQIDLKFKSVLKFILEEYLKMQEVFSDQEIPYVEDKIKIYYLGLSSKSIGVISLLLGDELKVDLPGEFENLEEELEMKESVLTAKIEAIAANTIGNTGAMPKWIAVKLGFQHYRFLTFKRYVNDYFVYFLSEGNLEKIKKVEDQLEPYISYVTDKPFSGNLKPFNRLKITLKEFFENKREFS
ncbi:MAG: hypothetical protein ACFFAN_08725 [Promethearchaeota archaeon]